MQSMQNPNEPLNKLPFMKTIRDAVAVSMEKADNFYLDAFMFQGWVGAVITETVQEYSEKKPRERSLQSGQARRIFQQLFGHATEDYWAYIFFDLLRFAEYQDNLAEHL